MEGKKERKNDKWQKIKDTEKCRGKEVLTGRRKDRREEGKISAER